MYRFSFESIYFEITAFCNRNCPYCYNDSDKSGNYLNKNVIYRVLQECSKKGIKHITISGGEPFCHPDITDILEEMDRLDIKGAIISNLSVLTEEQIEKLCLSGHSLQATLDSCEAEKNDLTRGKGSYDAVMNLLSLARKRGFLNRIALRFNLSKKNVSEVESMIQLAIENKMPRIDIALLTKSGRAATYDGVYDCDTDMMALAQLMKTLKEISERYKEKIKVTFSDLKEQVGCVLYAEGEISLSPKIDPNGNVFFCQLFSGEENSLGNVCDDSLSDILKSEKALRVAESVRQRKERQKECVHCDFTEFCMCGCPAISYNQTGDIYDKSDQCTMIKFFMKEKIKQLCEQDGHKRDRRAT